jgi:urease accessory protein
MTMERNTNMRAAGGLRVAALALLLTLAAAAPAQAHHLMGGRTPSTFMEGLLSGLGHPVIGIDHLAFIVAMGIAVGAAGLNLALPALFIAVSAVGVAMHVRGVTLPGAEVLVALSVLVVGAVLARGRAMTGAVWAVLFALAGLFHGYAFGESIYGAETSPLAAYLVGLIIVQGALASGIAWAARRTNDAALKTRLAGATIAGIGLAVLAGQFIPAG